MVKRWRLGKTPLSIAYTKRVGRPQHDDSVLFEFLILEGAQAVELGDILNKRTTTAAFDQFNVQGSPATTRENRSTLKIRSYETV